MKKHNFIIYFVEDHSGNKQMILGDNNTINSKLTLTERHFSCEAPSYEMARMIALDFAQKTVREHYDPFGIVAFFRICKG